MPEHHFVCRSCGDKLILDSPIGRSPNTPYCNTCRRRYSKIFGFSSSQIPIEIMSTGFGRFGSMRAYKAERDRRSAEHSERVGMDIQYDTFSPADNDQSPASNS